MKLKVLALQGAKQRLMYNSDRDLNIVVIWLHDRDQRLVEHSRVAKSIKILRNNPIYNNTQNVDAIQTMSDFNDYIHSLISGSPYSSENRTFKTISSEFQHNLMCLDALSSLYSIQAGQSAFSSYDMSPLDVFISAIENSNHPSATDQKILDLNRIVFCQSLPETISDYIYDVLKSKSYNVPGYFFSSSLLVQDIVDSNSKNLMTYLEKLSSAHVVEILKLRYVDFEFRDVNFLYALHDENLSDLTTLFQRLSADQIKDVFVSNIQGNTMSFLDYLVLNDIEILCDFLRLFSYDQRWGLLNLFVSNTENNTENPITLYNRLDIYAQERGTTVDRLVNPPIAGCCSVS